MDQGQLSTSLFKTTKKNGRLLLDQYNTPVKTPIYIPRERHFKPQTQLQIIEISNDFIPQTPLHNQENLPLFIDIAPRIYDPFTFMDLDGADENITTLITPVTPLMIPTLASIEARFVMISFANNLPGPPGEPFVSRAGEKFITQRGEQFRRAGHTLQTYFPRQLPRPKRGGNRGRRDRPDDDDQKRPHKRPERDGRQHDHRPRSPPVERIGMEVDVGIHNTNDVDVKVGEDVAVPGTRKTPAEDKGGVGIRIGDGHGVPEDVGIRQRRGEPIRVENGRPVDIPNRVRYDWDKRVMDVPNLFAIINAPNYNLAALQNALKKHYEVLMLLEGRLFNDVKVPSLYYDIIEPHERSFNNEFPECAYVPLQGVVAQLYGILNNPNIEINRTNALFAYLLLPPDNKGGMREYGFVINRLRQIIDKPRNIPDNAIELLENEPQPQRPQHVPKPVGPRSDPGAYGEEKINLDEKPAHINEPKPTPVAPSGLPEVNNDYVQDDEVMDYNAEHGNQDIQPAAVVVDENPYDGVVVEFPNPFLFDKTQSVRPVFLDELKHYYGMHTYNPEIRDDLTPEELDFIRNDFIPEIAGIMHEKRNLTDTEMMSLTPCVREIFYSLKKTQNELDEMIPTMSITNGQFNYFLTYLYGQQRPVGVLSDIQCDRVLEFIDGYKQYKTLGDKGAEFLRDSAIGGELTELITLAIPSLSRRDLTTVPIRYKYGDNERADEKIPDSKIPVKYGEHDTTIDSPEVVKASSVLFDAIRNSVGNGVEVFVEKVAKNYQAFLEVGKYVIDKIPPEEVINAKMGQAYADYGPHVKQLIKTLAKGGYLTVKTAGEIGVNILENAIDFDYVRFFSILGSLYSPVLSVLPDLNARPQYYDDEPIPAEIGYRPRSNDSRPVPVPGLKSDRSFFPPLPVDSEMNSSGGYVPDRPYREPGVLNTNRTPTEEEEKGDPILPAGKNHSTYDFTNAINIAQRAHDWKEEHFGGGGYHNAANPVGSRVDAGKKGLQNWVVEDEDEDDFKYW